MNYLFAFIVVLLIVAFYALVYGLMKAASRRLPTETRKESSTTEAWFRGLLNSLKGDPLFEAEGRILELEELIAKSAPLQWVWESDDDAAVEWEREALCLLQKEQEP